MAFFKKHVLCKFEETDPDNNEETVRSLSVIPNDWLEIGQDQLDGLSQLSDLKDSTLEVWWPNMKVVSEDITVKGKAPNKDTWTRLSTKILGHSSKLLNYIKYIIIFSTVLNTDCHQSK